MYYMHIKCISGRLTLFINIETNMIDLDKKSYWPVLSVEMMSKIVRSIIQGYNRSIIWKGVEYKSIDWDIDCCIKWAIFYFFIMASYPLMRKWWWCLFQTSTRTTVCWIYTVIIMLPQWNNSPRVIMWLHSEPSSCFSTN